MNQEETIRMANEAGMQLAWIATVPGSKKMKVLCDFDQVQRLVEIVAAAKEAEINDGLTIAYMDGYEKGKEAGAAAEREACAAICDRFQARDVGMQPSECAGAIRARGQA